MSTMHKSSRRNRISSHIRRDIFNYRYLKRNVLVMTIVVGMTALLAVVIKYGEALDSQLNYEVETVSAYEIEYNDTSITEESTTFTYENEVSNDSLQMVAKENDVLSESNQPSEFDNRFIAKISDTLNIRESASTDAAIVGKMFDGTVGDILGEEGEWTQISSGNVTGYVKTEFILTGEEAEEYAAGHKKLIGTITEETVRLRSDMSIESSVLDLVAKGTKLDVISEGDEWIKVMTATGQEGYIAADYISIEENYSTALSIAEYDAIYHALEEEKEEVTETTSEEATDETENQSRPIDTTEDQSQQIDTTETQITEQQSPVSEQEPEEETSTTVATDTSNYSDAYLLACLISMEAGSESYEGQLAVANVVLNRVNNGSWGGSISDVIYAPNQFPCATGSVMQNYLANGPLPTAQQAANDALAGNNNIGSFMSFLNVNYIDTDSLSDYKVIGNHCFY